MKWKSFEYRGIVYQVSDTGVVIGPRGKQISQRLNKDGYYEVTLGPTNQRNARVKVHRVVALSFVDGYQGGYEVNHKDYNRQNNCASNLEWVTYQDNIRHSSMAGRYNVGKHRGSLNGRSKLCERDVVAIRQMLKNKTPVSYLARQFGVGWTTIQHIKKTEIHGQVFDDYIFVQGVTTIGDECNRVRWLLIRQRECAAAILDGGRYSLRESVFDGDLVLVLKNEVMQQGVHKDIPIVIDVEDKVTAMVEKDTIDARVALTMRTMKSLIGEYSNYSSAYHNKCPRTMEQKQLYEKYVDQISILTGKAIDQFGRFGW